ncbi:unnamed protein product, partial [Vitis vinifera]
MYTQIQRQRFEHHVSSYCLLHHTKSKFLNHSHFSLMTTSIVGVVNSSTLRMSRRWNETLIYYYYEPTAPTFKGLEATRYLLVKIIGRNIILLIIL